MSKKSDDSIEGFFRKAVAQQDLSHLDADWKAMEKMLDDHATTTGTAPRFRKKAITYSAVALLLVLSSYFTIVQPWKKVSPNLHRAKQTVNNPIPDKASQAAAGMLGPLSSTKENPSADLLSSDNQVITTELPKISNGPQTATPPGADQMPATKESMLTNGEADVEFTHADQEPANVLPRSQEESDPVVMHSRDDGNPPSPEPSNVPLKPQSIISSEASGQAELADSVVELGVKTKDALVTEEDDEDKQVKTIAPTRWSIAASIAPDFSSTSVGRYSAPGTAYGVFISYRPFSRWQLSTGVIKSAKQYEGYGDEYQPPPGYWENRTNGVIPDEVDGNCGIIEWPLVVRFDFVAKTKHRFYAAAGVSSYWMRSESYEYYFAQENPGAASGWTASKPTSYSLSIGHLSVGYERSFSSRIAVAVEPYFKVPFKAIGWSNIELHTTGAYVTVRYTFQKQTLVSTTQN